jgi:hypothetical protein
LLLLLTLGAFASAGFAEDVEVTSVRFTNPRPPYGSNKEWWEMEITLNVKPVQGNAAQMLSRVRVAVLLGFELSATGGGDRRLEHYRADAECVALEPGRSTVRFYLPSEIVKRDQLHGDPRYWGIELMAGGKAVPAARGAYVHTLATPEQRKNFQTRGSAAAAANDGILQPQFLTPFMNEYPRDTPTFVRRDAR